MKTQLQMAREADQRVLDRYRAFHDLVTHPTNPLTRADLERLIERRPERYGMFANWLNVLK